MLIKHISSQEKLTYLCSGPERPPSNGLDLELEPAAVGGAAAAAVSREQLDEAAANVQVSWPQPDEPLPHQPGT